LSEEIHFCLPVGSSVRAQHLVKPYRRLVENIGVLPGLPRIIRLRFTGDKSPVDGSDLLLLGDTGPIAKGFGVHEIPHTFTIDADGVLQDEHIGDASIEGKLNQLVNRARELQTTAKQTQ